LTRRISAAFPIGRETVCNNQPTSNPSKQHKNDNDNRDDADNADTTMSAVTVTAEAPAEAAKQEYDEDDKKNE
jgi:hypothetical protein